jgi:hypothetical protein
VALSRMLENAKSMGANGVVEVLIDLVSMGGLQGSVIIVTATGTAVIFSEESNLGEDPSREDSLPELIRNDVPVVSEEYVGHEKSVIGEKPIVSEKFVASEDDLVDSKRINVGYGKINENLRDNVRSDDLSIEICQFVNEESDKITEYMELATKSYPNEELEKRFLKASRDLNRSKTE